jgi:hypothetical protein
MEPRFANLDLNNIPIVLRAAFVFIRWCASRAWIKLLDSVTANAIALLLKIQWIDRRSEVSRYTTDQMMRLPWKGSTS